MILTARYEQIALSCPAPGDVYLWKVFCPDHAASLSDHKQRFFTKDDLVDSTRYRTEKDLERFILARAYLRYLSATYLSLPHEDIRLAKSSHGKPYWDGVSQKLFFNISHSGQWVLLAFSSDAELGVDIQSVGTSKRIDDIVKRRFHEDEQAYYNDLPVHHKPEMFYRMWVCKEAIIKAQGLAVHGNLDQLNVLPCLNTHFEELEEAACMVREVDVARGYKAAIAVGKVFQDPALHEFDGRIILPTLLQAA
jgi:4'-phosphopantetheinyl transferase